MTKYDIFISYSRKDTAIADKICSALDAAGISYFIDRQGIGGGMEFPSILADAICESELFLFLASENSYNSKFTINEITFAFNEKPKQRILPYIIDKSVLPRQLRFVFAGINWRNISEHPINKVLIPDLSNLLKTSNKNRNEEVIEFYEDNPSLIIMDSGIRYLRLKKGIISNSPDINSVVTVHYEGSLTNGKIFDSSRKRGEYAKFSLSKVIPGFVYVLKQMTKGERVKALIPSQFAYGEQGIEGIIPANSDLIFDIELMDFE